MDLDFELYKGKKFSSLLKDIVVNSEDRDRTLDAMVLDLRAMIKTPNEALLIIPLIKECMDVTIRNDEQLIKLAAVVQRIINNRGGSEDGIGITLTAEERKQLTEEVEKLKIESPPDVSSVIKK